MMKQRTHKTYRFWQIAWLALLALLLLTLVVMPVSANSHAAQAAQAARQQSIPATTVAANIYITQGTLQPIFQSNINAQVPSAVSKAVGSIVGSLPQKDQGWAQQMASTLFQPSATLTGLQTESNGMLASLQLALYPGDPHPINASLLTGFNVASASTIQVTAQPVSGSPTLVSGPIATFPVPIGQLNSIKTTTTCGDASLNIGLQFPISLGQASTPTYTTNTSGLASPAAPTVERRASQRANTGNTANTAINSATDTNSYVEIPASSLVSIGKSIGSFPVSSSQTAKNIQLSVQGHTIVVMSDIYDSFWGHIGTGITLIEPTTTNGNLAIKVISTTFKLFGFISIPYNNYNQQIQQSFDQKLSGAFSGKFYATGAQIGPSAPIPCAASNSLLLTGSVNLG